MVIKVTSKPVSFSYSIFFCHFNSDLLAEDWTSAIMLDGFSSLILQ